MPNSKHLTYGISNLVSLITKIKLGLSTGSSSTYNLEGVPHSIDLVPENTFVREEAKAVTAPMAIMPPAKQRDKWWRQSEVHSMD
jgi:hypothetical protein